MSDGSTRRPLRAVALGGGHGLAASLAALRRLTDDVTAVVTVADDGGSAGRIRRELSSVLPPGDLRMALVALAGAAPDQRRWAEVLQHRIGGSGALAGHPVGNLMLTGLLETCPDPVTALRELAAVVGVTGRVLPMSPRPLDLVAEVDRFDRRDPARTREIHGQSSIATTPGRIVSVRLLPAGAPACAAAVDAVREADVVVLGPGSWFTSVVPHLLLRELGHALASTSALVIVMLNLVPQAGETDEYSPADLLRILQQHAEPVGGLRVDAVLADVDAVLDVGELEDYTSEKQARLVLSRLASDESAERHDPDRLAAAVQEALALGPGTDGEGSAGWR